MKQDLFAVWLQANKEHFALIDNSYKNYYSQENHRGYEGEVNTELATYGDAVLKLALCKILWPNNGLTTEKEKYESDKVLVRKIAKYYCILDYLKYDKSDRNRPQDYEYKGKKNKNPRKYIATAVEACLGAIYMEDDGFGRVLTIVGEWKNIIDDQEDLCERKK